jgi:hypothetical protein
MKLQLVLESSNQSWTLDSTREYLIGSSSDCDIRIIEDRIAPKHLKLSFDSISQIWNLQDLSGDGKTIMNNQPLNYAPIHGIAKVKLSDIVSLTITPENATVAAGVAAPTMYSPPSVPSGGTYSTDTVRNNGFREAIFPSGGHHAVQSQTAIQKTQVIKELNWGQYVKEQVDQQEGFFTKLITRFSLITGLRNTPWVKSFNYQGFEGYIIPDFQGNVETVISTIEQQIGQLQQYDDTDCYIAQLTDAHITDTTGQGMFSGIDFFPIRRGRRVYKGDYRRFCVTSYHHVRTYVLIEKYGADLFVSWITRFEPQSKPLIAILLLAIACLIFCIMALGILPNLYYLSSGGQLRTAITLLSSAFFPLAIWATVYMLTPKTMDHFGILPKGSNARVMIGILLTGTFILYPLLSFLMPFALVIVGFIALVVLVGKKMSEP